jgi:hypothetical protein
MDENRLYGTARNVSGKIEEGVGYSLAPFWPTLSARVEPRLPVVLLAKVAG